MPRTSLRLLASLALVLGASAQLGALAHLALVPHVRCDAHGTIEHADAHGPASHRADAHDLASRRADAHDASAHRDHDARDRSDAPAWVAGGEHAHDGCATLAMRDDRAPTHAPPALAAPIAHPASASGAAPAELRLASRALDLAPKTSPPA